jgi:hypothetical protein
MRWCAAHAKGRAGLVDARSKKCEDCEAKEPSYGLAGADGKGKKRWCAGGCARGRVLVARSSPLAQARRAW